jgi:AraC-like DNA-binding protein
LGGDDLSLYLTVPGDLMAWFSGAPSRAPLRTDLAHAVRSAAVHASKGGMVPSLHLEELALLARSATSVMVEMNEPRRVAVRRAEEYLACHYGDDADLRTVAAHVGYSPHHLSRVFRQATGMSLSGYRTRLRLSGAIDRLLAGESDIARVAVDCGFYDHPHLIRQLRRHAGSTPSEIRLLGGFPGLAAPNKPVG